MSSRLIGMLVWLCGCFLALCSTSAFGGTPKITFTAKVELKAPLDSDGRVVPINDDDSEQHFMALYSVYVRNVGPRDVTIPTTGFFTKPWSTLEGTRVEFCWEFQQDADGTVIVQSPTDLKLVTLRPGETTKLSWEFPGFRRSRFHKVGVSVSIPADFGRRYGCWYGTARAEAVLVSVQGRDPVTVETFK